MGGHTVPGPVALAVMTNRPELVEGLRGQIKAGLTEEAAEGVCDAAIELVQMRQELLDEAERLEQLLVIGRQSLRGMESSFLKIEARIAAFRSGTDPDDAEEAAKRAYTGRG